MPTLEQTRAEDFTWRVIYDDGTVLSEAELCSDLPGSVHVWACVDTARGRLLEVLDHDGRVVHRVGCIGDAAPVFFRRRQITVHPDGRPQEWDRGETWAGFKRPDGARFLERVSADGVTQYVTE